MSKSSLNWVNLVFFILTPIAAVAGLIWRYQTGTIPWETWVLAIVMFYLTGFGITAGYHRLFSHKSYKASWPVRLTLLLWGSATFEASARWWASEHRYHHQFVDTDRDPYGINKGFWYAHIGWLVNRKDARTDFANIADLDKDPLIKWQHRYYLPLAIIVSFGLPTFIASLWGDVWGGFFLAGMARMVFVQHWTWCINSMAHTFGHQPYSDRHTAKDNWLAALFTYGEGYHNFHHEFPADYRNGIRYYQYDPTKWLIRFWSYMGLVSDLKMTPQEKILEARLMMDRKRVVRRWAIQPMYLQAATEKIDGAMEHIRLAYQRFIILKKEYRNLKRQKLASMSQRIVELKREMAHAKSEFKQSWDRWKILVNSPIPA